MATNDDKNQPTPRAAGAVPGATPGAPTSGGVDTNIPEAVQKDRNVDKGPLRAMRAAGATGGSADFIKVTNERAAPLGLPPITLERAKQLGLDTTVDHLDQFLAPGENDVRSEYWDAVKGQPPVRNWIEEGWLREGGAQVRRAAGPSFRETLDGVPDDEAQRLIDGSSDREQLQRWARAEKRPAVRDAIQRRFDSLGAGK